KVSSLYRATMRARRVFSWAASLSSSTARVRRAASSSGRRMRKTRSRLRIGMAADGQEAPRHAEKDAGREGDADERRRQERQAHLADRVGQRPLQRGRGQAVEAIERRQGDAGAERPLHRALGDEGKLDEAVGRADEAKDAKLVAASVHAELD